MLHCRHLHAMILTILSRQLTIGDEYQATLIPLSFLPIDVEFASAMTRSNKAKLDYPIFQYRSIALWSR